LLEKHFAPRKGYLGRRVRKGGGEGLFGIPPNEVATRGGGWIGGGRKENLRNLVGEKVGNRDPERSWDGGEPLSGIGWGGKETFQESQHNSVISA